MCFIRNVLNICHDGSWQLKVQVKLVFVRAGDTLWNTIHSKTKYLLMSVAKKTDIASLKTDCTFKYYCQRSVFKLKFISTYYFFHFIFCFCYAQKQYTFEGLGLLGLWRCKRTMKQKHTPFLHTAWRYQDLYFCFEMSKTSILILVYPKTCKQNKTVEVWP